MHFDYTQCKQKGFAGIILIVVLILAGLGGAYFFGKSQVSKPQLQITAIPTPSAQVDVSPAPNGARETVSWKTYTNTNGYLVKYPSNFYIDSQNSQFSSQIFIRSSQSKTYAVSISSQVKQNASTIEDFISNKYFYKSISLSNYKTKPTIVDNHQAYFLELKQGTVPNDYLQDFTFIEQDASHIIIVYSFPIYKADNDPNKILFDQILSTFKFLP